MAEEAAPLRDPRYSDLVQAAMERASTAKEAVEVNGGLMDKHDYLTCGGDSHLFAAENEGWVFVNFAHPDGDLWAAERIGSDEARVSYFGYVLDFPVDHEDDPDFMGSDKLVSFAEEGGLVGRRRRSARSGRRRRFPRRDTGRGLLLPRVLPRGSQPAEARRGD